MVIKVAGILILKDLIYTIFDFGHGNFYLVTYYSCMICISEFFRPIRRNTLSASHHDGNDLNTVHRLKINRPRQNKRFSRYIYIHIIIICTRIK